MDRPVEEEWRNFELYEKVRVRENRKRLVLITLTAVAFFSLCAVPVVAERSPKWQSLRAARDLSIQLEHLKTLSIQEKKPIRLRLLESGHFQFEIVNECQSETPLKIVNAGEWPNAEGALKILTLEEAKSFSLKVATDKICFDPVFGLDGVKSRKVVVVVPVNDLSERRLDRASYIILDGESAKISIN